MKPDKIYVKEYHNGSFNSAWETKRKDDPWVVFHEYIRKETLLEYVKDRLAQYDPEYTNAGKELQMIIDKINSI